MCKTQNEPHPEIRPWLQLYLCYLTTKKIFSFLFNLVQTLWGIASRHRSKQNVESALEDWHERGNHIFSVATLSIDNAFCRFYLQLGSNLFCFSLFFIFIFFWLLLCTRQMLNPFEIRLMAIIISKTMENSLFSVSFMHVCMCFHQSTNFSNFVGLNRNENPLSTKHEHTKFIHFSHIYQGKFFLLHMFKFNSMIFGKWFWKIQRGLSNVLNDLPLNEIHWILFSLLLLF